MIKLFSVFSDNALFQAESILTLRGYAVPSAQLYAIIERSDKTVVSRSTAASDKAGFFAITLNTPCPSFDTYTITVTCGDTQATLQNVQFGELWLASGQSNMEMTNVEQPEYHKILSELEGKMIRVYNVSQANDFPAEPKEDVPGHWIVTDADNKSWARVSACATAFCIRMADRFLRMKKEIPIGFVNVAVGGTPIMSWMPLDLLLQNKKALEMIDEMELLPVAEKWRSHFQNPAAMYNTKITPLIGLKFRGNLWYQGCNDLYTEFEKRYYQEFQQLLYTHYAELFAADDTNFPMLSVLLFPASWGCDGECFVGYLNCAIIRNEKTSPDTFISCPISDFSPSWASNRNNDFTHPTNKYRVGFRMADIAAPRIYGDIGQREIAILDSYRIEDDRMILTFTNRESDIFVKGDHVHGLYIAGENRLYLEAECEVLSPNTLAVWHPYLKKPCHCAYAFASFIAENNLFCGEFPVAPFATDYDNTEMIIIKGKPFIHFDLTSIWEFGLLLPEWNSDSYFRPIWRPLFDSDVCQDRGFVEVTEGKKYSLRIGGDQGKIGAYVKSSKFYSLDLQNYETLIMDLYARGTVKGHIEICYPKDTPDIGMCRTIVRSFEPIDGAPYMFQRYKANLDDLPDDEEISALKFVFEVEDSWRTYFVNIAKLELVPRL